MKSIRLLLILSILLLTDRTMMASATNLIPPNHPFIQYVGRWDKADSLRYRYSWPGVSVSATFTGTSVGVRLIDGTNYFNVYIDGVFYSVFHGGKPGEADYILAKGLERGHHTLRLTRRNITFEAPYAFCGILLDDGATLVPPPPRPSRRIEFIGDSFTAAESNEAKEQQLPWEARYPVTNFDKGFAAVIAQHFNAEGHTTCRSGSGMLCDWQGSRSESIPGRFDRTLMESGEPKWDYRQWIPDVIVICLGLNDHSGLKDKDGKVPDDKSALFRKAYHGFLDTLRNVYPGVVIVAVAAYPEWIRRNVRKVVDAEIAAGRTDVHYATFDEFPGGYVANGHPTVDTHRKMADQLIREMESFSLFGKP